MMQQISKEVDEFPKRVEKLKAAKEAVFSDMEDTQLRGGVTMSESMNRNFAVK
jgi:archaellum component FlaC